jgi:microcystin-dependent protein
MGNNQSNGVSYNNVVFKEVLKGPTGLPGSRALADSGPAQQQPPLNVKPYSAAPCFKKNTDNITPLSTTSEAIKDVAKQYNAGVMNVKNLVVKNDCNLIPKGIIIMWSRNEIPAGWIECDGKNNCTPDLRGRSILGFDTTKTLNNLNQYGGEITHKLNINEMPAHGHTYNTASNPISFVSDVDGFSKEYTIGQSDVIDLKPAYSYSHIEGGGAGMAHNNMPPYTVLRYIMKI